MFKCKICNKEFKNSLALRGHSRIHSPKESARIKEKQQKYENHKDSISNIFLDNKYTKIYYKIISKARKTTYSGYTEKHHVLPRSLGGENKNNLVKMSAREHFLCHYLLTKMIDNKSIYYYKMVKAFYMMKNNSKNRGDRYINSHLYANLKTDFSISQSQSQLGNKNSQYGRVWVSDIKNEKSIKIKKHDLPEYIKNGWIKKRITNFEKYKNKKIIKTEKITNSIEKYKNKKVIKTKKITNSTCETLSDFLNLSPCNKIILEKYNSGMSTREISKIVNLSHVSISLKIKAIKRIT